MEYPKKFEACPNCGSKDRVAQMEADEEISNGNLKVDTKIAVMISKTAVFNPADTTIVARKTIPILVGFFDVCADCGTMYCVEMHKETGTAQPQIRHGPGDDGGGLSFLGKG